MCLDISNYFLPNQRIFSCYCILFITKFSAGTWKSKGHLSDLCNWIFLTPNCQDIFKWIVAMECIVNNLTHFMAKFGTRVTGSISWCWPPKATESLTSSGIYFWQIIDFLRPYSIYYFLKKQIHYFVHLQRESRIVDYTSISYIQVFNMIVTGFP